VASGDLGGHELPQGVAFGGLQVALGEVTDGLMGLQMASGLRVALSGQG
jgi:hypothetical protein